MIQWTEDWWYTRFSVNILLGKKGQLHILHNLYAHIWIPSMYMMASGVVSSFLSGLSVSVAVKTQSALSQYLQTGQQIQ